MGRIESLGAGAAAACRPVRGLDRCGLRSGPSMAQRWRRRYLIVCRLMAVDRSVAVGELPNFGFVEELEEPLSASGQLHRLGGVVGAVGQGGADVVFEAGELQEGGLLVEPRGGGGGVGHGVRGEL